MHVAPGTRVGPYEIVERLGAGGMGDVWRGARYAARSQRGHQDHQRRVGQRAAKVRITAANFASASRGFSRAAFTRRLHGAGHAALHVRGWRQSVGRCRQQQGVFGFGVPIRGDQRHRPRRHWQPTRFVRRPPQQARAEGRDREALDSEFSAVAFVPTSTPGCIRRAPSPDRGSDACSCARPQKPAPSPLQ